MQLQIIIVNLTADFVNYLTKTINFMKKSTLLAIFFMAIFVLGTHHSGWGQVTLPHHEPFNYTVGQALQTQTGWTAVNSGDDILISSGSIDYLGLQASTANKVSFADAGIDAYKAFTSQSSGVIYYSFVMNVTGLSTLNATGGYFTGLASNSTTFGATVWTGLDGTGYKIGINPRTSTSTNMVWVSGTQTLNNNVFIVVSYEIVSGTGNDIVKIWVNPAASSFGTVGEPTPNATVTNTSGTDLASVGQFFLRQDSNTETPFIEMDECRVGLTWADVTPSSGATIAALPASLTGFSYAGSGPSTEQSFVAAGVNLTNDITITPPANYEISTGTGGAFVATNPVTLTQTAGTVANTTIYTRLKAGLAVGTYNAEDITIASTGATSKTVTCSGSVLEQLDYVNLQWPPTPTIAVGEALNVYAQVYETGVTPGNGTQGAGITCWIGYSTSNTNPNNWTNWIPATFNSAGGGDNNDEYMANLGAEISAPGTYYFASRFQLGAAPYVYGGYSGTGGGFWDGTSNVSGVLTATAAPQLDWVNVQWPASGTIASGGAYDVYAQVYKSGLTEPAGQGAGVTAWIGYSSSNTNPDTWTNWVAATYNGDSGNNDEYKADLGTAISGTGVFYYASRFKLGAAPYVYGGFNGGFWNGTGNNSGVLTIESAWTSGYPKAENAISSGFTAKVSVSAIGTSYFVVLPSGAAAPSSAQVKAGQDATGTPLAANLTGTIACAASATEYTSVVSGLSASTTYDIYFVAEDAALLLQATPVLKSVTTTAAPTAPLVSSPTATSVTNNSATLGGDVTSDGGSAITERGTVWATATGVAITDNKLAEGGTTTGVFSHSRTGLPSGVQIFYKAYATNAAGTTLSTEASFYTLSDEPTTHVTGFAAAAASTTSIDLSWTVASTGAYGYMVLQATGNTAPTGLPADAISYGVGSVIGDGTVAAMVTPGTALATTISGLSPATQYSFTIIPFNYSGFATATFNFYTDPIIPSATATTDTPPFATYTWQGADNAAWNVATNWNPTRTAPAVTDVLQFNDGTNKTVTAVPAETIGRLVLANNTTVNLQSSAAVILAIAGSTGTDLEIPAGCALNLNAINAISISLATGATGSVSGTMTYSATASTGHRLLAADASSITFNNGSSITVGPFCTGSIFGTTSLNSVVFASGSAYIAKSGSNPFGAGQPNSVVVFQTGSVYRIEANLTPSLSGRTYADLVVDFPTALLNTSGGFATSIDNLTVTNGTLNFNMTGTPGHSIKGNITVGATGVLNFAPASAGTVNLNGTTAQTINVAGTLSFGANSTIAVNNLAGITVNNSGTLNNLTLTDGVISTGANTLTVNGTLTGGSATSYIDGKLALPFAVASAKTFPIGKSGNYRPLLLTYTLLDAPSVVTASQTESAMSGTIPAGANLFTDRFWTLTQTGATAFAYDITLDGTGFIPAATPVILKNDAGSVSVNTTTGTAPAYTASGLTSFSDFALASYVAPPVITSSPATLTGFGYIQGSGPSAEQTFTVSGANLTADISIAASTNYEVSLTSGAGFTSPLTLAQTAGTVSNTTIYVRLKAGLTAGAYNGEILNITSTGATTNAVTCSGTVINPVLSAGTLADFGNVCINTTAGPLSFTVTGTDLSTSDVTIGALAGFSYSASAAGTYTSTLSLTQTGGAFSTTVYVKFNPTLVQSYNGNIPVGGGGAPTVNVAATGSGVNTAASVTTISPATAITGVSATADGNVTDAGCATVTARGICYGTTTNPDITGSKTTEAGTTGAFSSNLTGLTPATTYYYRAYATTSVTTSYGAEFSFTTLAVAPTVTTLAATLVTGTDATLNGSVNANNSPAATAFEYGLTTAYGTTVTAVPAAATGTSSTAISYALTGLTPNTTYHFRAVATNVAGSTPGNDLTFTTSAVVPSVTTDAASLITSSSATLNGTVNANNTATAVTFEYGTSVAYGTTVAASPASVSGTTATAVLFALSGLEPNTTYHYRAVGVNSAGTTNGNDISFTTSALAPVAVTTAATAIGASSATMNGTVNANNQASTVTFEYGLTVAYGSSVNAVPNVVNGFTSTAVSASLTGLALSQTYHYRVVAVNATGTTYGDDLTFFTNCILPDPAGTISGQAVVCQTSAGIAYSVPAINLATSYVWTVPAGATIVSGNGTNSIVVDFGAAAVSGNISVYGSSACGDGSSSSLAVSVTPLPVPVISGSAIACLNEMGNLYTTESGMTGYNWTISAGGTITSGASTNQISVTWTTSGAKTVTVNYTNAGGCQAPAATVFNLSVNGTPAPTLAGTTEVCAGTNDVVYTTEAGFSNYQWSVSYGGTITSGLSSNEVTVNWATAGARTISVNYDNSLGCNANTPATLGVTVLSVPAPVIAGETEVCEGTTGVVYTTQANETDYVWTVSSGGSITSGAGTNQISVNWNGNGNQTVSATYTNDLGCSAIVPALLNVFVDPKPAASGAISGTASVCASSNGVAYSVDPIANATDYVWTLPAGATLASGSGTNSITVDFASNASSGTIKVYGTNTCGNGTASPAFNVVVNPIPATPVITQSGDTLTSSAATGNQWYLDGVEIPGATGNKHIAVYIGNYTVVVTNNGCSSAPSNSILVLPVSIDEAGLSKVFDVYPNPNNGQFNLKIETHRQEYLSVEVYNSIGSLVWKLENTAVNGLFTTNIDLKGSPSGIYSVALKNKNSSIVKKIVIMN